MGSILKNKLGEEAYYTRKTSIKDEVKDTRTPFLKDQTAIIHSRSFQRLKNKTQLISMPCNDHICTRMEHSLYVGSIAGVIAKNLDLNVELTQAIGFGHDIGHPPFGHRGEEALKELFGPRHLFRHADFGLRLVDTIEQYGRGLNLTFAVRNGILSHSGVDERFYTLEKIKQVTGEPSMEDYPMTWEACVVKISDTVAFLGRDLEDAVQSKIIEKDWRELVGYLIQKPVQSTTNYWEINSSVINVLVKDIVNYSKDHSCIGYSENVFDLVMELNKLENDIIRKAPEIEEKDLQIKGTIETLKKHYQSLTDGISYKRLKAEERLEIITKKVDEKVKPSAIANLNKSFFNYIKNHWPIYEKESDPERVILDYIASMTDRKASENANTIVHSGVIS